MKNIIRTEKAGVFFGDVKSRKGNEVILNNVRRIWRWDGACSLSQLAVDGTSCQNKCKFSVAVEEMTIFGVIELIPCTEKAMNSINGVKEWKS